MTISVWRVKNSGHHRTKKENPKASVNEPIQRRGKQAVLSLFGTIDYDKSYDYKRERRSKRT